MPALDSLSTMIAVDGGPTTLQPPGSHGTRTLDVLWQAPPMSGLQKSGYLRW